KCNEEVTTWMRRRRLDEPAFLLRWRQIVLALAAETAPAPPPTASASPVADDGFPPVEGAIRDR
ncbi:hypothetical protein NQ160_13835, partial [Microbacterium sp. zg.Y909]|nr:hypothetical protein [Microbacterium sp. zg.Y909]